MAESTQKQPPAPVRHALTALDALRAQDAELAAGLEHLLPAYAMRLSQSGTEVGVDSLLQAAQQGEAYLKKSLHRHQPQGAQDFTARYAEIAATLPNRYARTQTPNIRTLAGGGDIVQLKKMLDDSAENPLSSLGLDEAFYAALAGGHDTAALLLLDHGADRDKALATAAGHGSTQMVILLLERGADIHTGYGAPLKHATEHGHIETVRLLLERGEGTLETLGSALSIAAASNRIEIAQLLLNHGAATDNYNAGYALISAAARGFGDMVRLLLSNGVDLHTENDNALCNAAANGQGEIIELLLDRGANIAAADHQALCNAASNGHAETVRQLLDRGANVHAQQGLALCWAAAKGHTAIVRLLLERGAYIHGNSGQALHSAAENGHAETVRLLLEHGANVHAGNDAALRLSARRNHAATVDVLLDHGADIGKLEPAQYAAAKKYKHNIQRWRDTVRVAPPRFLETRDPSLFKPALFAKLADIFAKESYDDEKTVHSMAYNTMALLQNETRILQYLQKWGQESRQPLHDLIHMIALPDDVSNANLPSWGDAVLQHGPKMAHMVKFCDRMQQPLRSEDGKSWSYLRTRAEAAKYAYNRAAEHPQLAKLCFENMIGEKAFEKALDIVQDVPPKKRDMPDITIDGARFGLEGATFHKLPNGDIRGLFLGALTDCCQSIGNDGGGCAEHGYTSPNGGFYVVETAQGEIIGQSWAWRGEKGELCLDSLETLGNRVSEQQWKALMGETAKELAARKNHGVNALHVGIGGKTPTGLRQHFEEVTAMPVDYSGYRDSKTQIRVWKR